MHDDDLTDEAIAAEIARLRDRIRAMEAPDRSGPAGTPGTVRELAIHPMPVANRDRREYHLFYDLFVHGDRRKLCAVAPYYGDDFDFEAHGIDLDRVEIFVRGRRIAGRCLRYGLEGWEPSILFDFEHPDLPGLIAESSELEVRVVAGEAERTFWIDTEAQPAHRTSVALCVRDENRWIGFYLEYYLDILGVDHVYLYDNRTHRRGELRKRLEPFAGRVTLIEWDFEWRNRVDAKQIGQPPQEAHTLARFYADRWIGFFDVDEFLHLPEGSVLDLLAPYDPTKIGAVGFKMLWGVYKGERTLDDILNPLVEFAYAREDAYWNKRWKLFVSPAQVRFMRFHWIQEDRETVHRSDVRYYHLFLRDFRFEEGKGDEGLGAECFRDETLREVWESHERAREPRRRDPDESDLVRHVRVSFERASRGESKLSSEAQALGGMIGRATRHFYNNLCSLPGTRLLEIGSWKGASTCALLEGNDVTATVVDNWSQWGNHRDQCLANVGRHRGRSRVDFIESDCFRTDPGRLGRYDVYVYDGSHGEADQFRAVVDFYRFLEDEAVIVIDDWNWARVRRGTRRALDVIDAEVVYRREISVPEVPRARDGKPTSDPDSWWNGIACFVLRRRDRAGAP